MTAAFNLSNSNCDYCRINPRRAADLFCCDGCALLAQMEHKKLDPSSDQGPSLEDQKLTLDFGKQQGGLTAFYFQVDPLACEACLQGLVRVREFYPAIRDIEWDRNLSSLKILFYHGQELPTQIYGFLKSLKLNPKWLSRDSLHKVRSVHRQRILRIGLLAALAGNIMMFAVPTYVGIAPEWKPLFEHVQGLIFLPVLLWGALPIYQSAISSFRLRQLSVDLPLALAFLSGSLLSYASLIQGNGQIYFDSLSGFLFLILLSRFLMENSIANSLRAPTLETLFDNPYFKVRSCSNRASITSSFEDRQIGEIQVGDLVQVPQGGRIPVDGVLISEGVEIDTSWLDGESLPRLRMKGASVSAGAKVISANALIRVECEPLKTDFAKLIGEVSKVSEKLGTSWEAKVGNWLVLACFGLILFLMTQIGSLGSSEVFKRSLALLIVACPCAVSFAAPMARARASFIARKLGFWIRDPKVWDRLRDPQKIAFDKTGTLTEGILKLSQDSPMIDEHLKRIILSLENQSQHPIAEALRKAWGQKELFEVSNGREVVGQGVEGSINGHFYELHRRAVTTGGAQLVLRRDHREVLELDMDDSGKPEVLAALKELQKTRSLYLLSGDTTTRVHTFARKIGVPVSHAWGGLTPQEKLKVIQELAPDVYVGDGTNDVLALRSATVSVAPASAAAEAKAAADLVMMGSEVHRLGVLFEIGAESRKVVQRNLQISLIYNVFAGAAAVFGMINPLVAAVLMPISSLALGFSTLMATRKLRDIERSAQISTARNP